MSRIGKMPIPLPPGVEAKLQDHHLRVTGPLGALELALLPEVEAEIGDGQILITRRSDSRQARARHGLMRTLAANLVEGVSRGFRKELELYGLGYRVQIQGSKLVMQLGFSHPVVVDAPPGIEFAAETFTPTSENQYLAARIAVSGFDKGLVGQTSANIRKARKPEPYKGKGLRYRGERVRRKAGKSAAQGR